MTTRLTADAGKTNFMHDFSDESGEMHAYQEILDYLIKTGRYADATEADNDARERVRFCEEINLYADDPRLKNASLQQRKIHALIHSNKLQAVIAENGGYLPGSEKTQVLPPAVNAEVSETSPAACSAPDHGQERDLVSTDFVRSIIDLSAAEPATKKAVMRNTDVDIEVPSGENSFLQVARYVSKVLIIVAILLASSVFFFSSDEFLQFTKYTFFLFVVVMIVSVGLSDVSSRLMLRLHYAVGYLSLISSATLSGLLFLQQPWTESAFNLRGGLIGIMVNFILHKIIAIGPFWLGVFFAVIASAFLVTTWRAGRKIKVGLSAGR
jgi:hypothetical protein